MKRYIKSNNSSSISTSRKVISPAMSNKPEIPGVEYYSNGDVKFDNIDAFDAYFDWLLNQPYEEVE